MPDQPKPEPERDAAAELEKADVELGAKIASKKDHPLAKAAGEASKIGDQEPLYAMSAGVLLVGLVCRNPRLSGSGLSMLAAVGAADLTKRLAKSLVSRTRPHVLLDDQHYEAQAGGSDEKPEQSFPSGHTACSVAAARALSREYPRAGAAAGVGAVAIGISRMVKGAHWPLDVLGGAIIGLAAEALTATLLERGWCGLSSEQRERLSPWLALQD
jgi:membrane-associated phospholipid phosphatase